jgi:hypothetical protein
MCDNIEIIIYCFIDSIYTEYRYMIITYYVTPFVFLLLNYLPHYIFCLDGIYVTTFITSTISEVSVEETISLIMTFSIGCWV